MQPSKDKQFEWFKENRHLFKNVKEQLSPELIKEMGVDDNADELMVLTVDPKSSTFDAGILYSKSETQDLQPKSTDYLVYFFQKSLKQLRLFKRFQCLHKVDDKHQCGMLIPSLSKLLEHQRFHLGEKPFQCTFCKLQFSQKGNLDTHVKTVHFLTQRLECQHCHKLFQNKSNLKAHLEREK